MKPLPAFFAGVVLMAANGASAQSSAGSLSADEDIPSLPAGLLLGTDAFTHNNFNEFALYPVATVELGNGLLSVGILQSTVDTGYTLRRNLANSSIANFNFSQEGDGAELTTTRYLFEEDTPYGVRFDRVFGNTKIGASYQRFNIDTDGTDIYGLGVQHELDVISNVYGMQFFSGIEHSQTDSINITSYYIGAEGVTERLRAGISVDLDERFGNIDLAEIYARYDVTDALSVDATASQLYGDGSSLNSYSLGMEYEILEKGYLRANYIDAGTFFSGSSLWEIAAGWRF